MRRVRALNARIVDVLVEKAPLTARIDELRVGGQTKRIEVQPKNGAPAYQITTEPGVPSSKGDVAGQRTGNAGRSSWRILSF